MRNLPFVLAEDDRKLLCQLLGKLYIPEETSDLALHSLLLLIDSLKEVRPLSSSF